MQLTKDNVPDFIKKLRSDSNLTLQQFGELFGVSGQSIYNWERGASMPSTFQQTLLIEFRKKIDNLLLGSVVTDKPYITPQVDLSKLLLTIGTGVGVIIFLKWLLDENA